MKTSIKRLNTNPVRGAVDAGRLSEISESDLKAVAGGTAQGSYCLIENYRDDQYFGIHGGYPESG